VHLHHTHLVLKNTYIPKIDVDISVFRKMDVDISFFRKMLPFAHVALEGYLKADNEKGLASNVKCLKILKAKPLLRATAAQPSSGL
jgi:hypothetical protein